LRDSHKEKVIESAIQEYKNSILFGFGSSALHAINMMELAYYMCAPFNIKGMAELKKTIEDAVSRVKGGLEE
jgi:hypothetical protein